MRRWNLQVETANAYARVGEILSAEDLRDVMDPATGDAVLAKAETSLRRLRVLKCPTERICAIMLARTLMARAVFAEVAKIDHETMDKHLDEMVTLVDPVIEAQPSQRLRCSCCD